MPAIGPTDAPPPVACTLDAQQMPDRMADWQAVLARVAAREALAGGVRLTLDADVSLEEVARLAVAEQDCCRFFSFVITVDERGKALEVRAPEEAFPIVEALFGTAP
jgi:hypothetical protein